MTTAARQPVKAWQQNIVADRQVHHQTQPALAGHKADARADRRRRACDTPQRPITPHIGRRAANAEQPPQHAAGAAAQEPRQPDHFAGAQTNGVGPCSHVFEQNLAGRQRLRFDFRRGAAGHGCNQVADFEVAAAARCRDAAVAQHRAAVGERDHLVQSVRNVNDRRALNLHPRQHGEQSLDLVGLERRRGLVENEDLALFAQRFGDRDQLTFGEAETIDAAVGIRSKVELHQFRSRLTAHAHTVNDFDTQHAPQRRVAERQVLGN